MAVHELEQAVVESRQLLEEPRNVHAGLDVKYTIDNLNRLTDAQEGTYSAGSISSETRQQTWTLLDQLGNWDHVKLDLDGDGDWSSGAEYDDDRTHNVVNELTARDTDDNGSNNYTLTYDAAGHLTDDKQSYKYVYDAWGRLVTVKDQSFIPKVVAEYRYNGINHRIGVHYDTDADGTVEANSDDPWLWLYHDERWRLVAVVEEDSGDTDEPPVEEFILHQAGLDGLGGSSYIDDVILRDRDADGSGGGSLEERRYLCQNWRHDVSAVVTDVGKMIEWGKYTSYGVPDALPAGDTDSDNDWDATDSAAITGGYELRKDAELDGDVDANDITHANSITGGYQTLGWNVLSSTGVKNRKGYAGYERDHSAGVLYHVRHRVLNTTLGRWTRRDPLGYVDGANVYTFVAGRPISETDENGLRVTSMIPCTKGTFQPLPPTSCNYGWDMQFEADFVMLKTRDGLCIPHTWDGLEQWFDKAVGIGTPGINGCLCAARIRWPLDCVCSHMPNNPCSNCVRGCLRCFFNIDGKVPTLFEHERCIEECCDFWEQKRFYEKLDAVIFCCARNQGTYLGCAIGKPPGPAGRYPIPTDYTNIQCDGCGPGTSRPLDCTGY